MRKRELGLVIGLVIIGTLLVGRVVAQGSLEKELDTYLQVLDVLKNEYVQKDLDDQKLVYGSIRGMLSTLDDPYTRFMEPKAYKEMQIRMSGSYSGIGIYIGIKNDQLMVISPIDGTPADRAKLRASDKIITIEDKSTKNMALEEAVSIIRGPQGSNVKLGILRRGWKEPKDINIKRAKITIKSLNAKTVDSDIAYIKLNTFENVSAATDFEKSLRSFSNVKGLIIDLRGNGGGLLQNAVDIGSMFIDNGMIVQTIDRDGRREQLDSSGRVIWRKPTVVLINESSASASEILAGAMRDNKVATLVGAHSFGKASVQNVKRLSDGSALLLTIAKYLTPNGEDIMKKGIKPDVEVNLPSEEAEVKAEAELEPENEAADIQLVRAIQVLRQKIAGEGHGKV